MPSTRIPTFLCKLAVEIRLCSDGINPFLQQNIAFKMVFLFLKQPDLTMNYDLNIQQSCNLTYTDICSN